MPSLSFCLLVVESVAALALRAVDFGPKPVLRDWSRLADGRFTGSLGDHTVWMHPASVQYSPEEQRIAHIVSRGGKVYELGEQAEAAYLLLPLGLSLPDSSSARWQAASLAVPKWPSLAEAVVDDDFVPKITVACGFGVLLMLIHLAIVSSPDPCYV